MCVILLIECDLPEQLAMGKTLRSLMYTGGYIEQVTDCVQTHNKNAGC